MGGLEGWITVLAALVAVALVAYLAGIDRFL
jgi:Flp pilus assembly pilin Flp